MRKLRKLEPDAIIAVCGCLSQLDADAASQLGADIVGGSGNRIAFADEIEKRGESRRKKRILNYVGSASEQSEAPPENAAKSRVDHSTVDNPFERRGFEELPVSGGSGRTRAFLKVEDGCDNFCAYCIIPFARGSVRSLPVEQAVSGAEKLAQQGYKEIVITGIEISSYGKDLGGNTSIIDVIKNIGKAVPNVRLRIGSLDPFALTDVFCNQLSEIPNLCGHFHLSLQSGCDKILRSMGRKYGTKTVVRAISRLRSLFPDCGITADLIVGFPGETQADFDESMAFIKSARFSGMHIFPFSVRTGTKAAKMENQVSKEISRARAKKAGELAAHLKSDFLHSQKGKSVEVLFERERGGYWVGHSGSYIEVAVRGAALKNSVLTVKITDIVDECAIGEIVLHS